VLDPVQQDIILQAAQNPALAVYALGKSKDKAKELASIKDPVKFAFALGKLENQKHKILHQMNDIEKEFDDMQKELEKTYGKVSINIDNGELSEIPEKDE